MSDKRIKKNTSKNSKKATKGKKIPTLKLDNGNEIPEKTTYMKDTECFEINDIDVHEIIVSDKRLYSKQKSI